MEWLTDENGNRASIEYFGSKEAAQRALDSLRNCINCINCNSCIDCNNCINCINCISCINCINCNNCISCKIKGLTRSDGYTFYLDSHNHIRAGCRDFATFEDARKHWTETRGGTKLGIESLAALDALEQALKLD